MLNKEIKISTIVHFAILFLCLIYPIIFHRTYKIKMPAVHNVRLINLSNIKTAQAAAPSVTKKSAVPAPAPKISTAKPKMTVPAKEEKMKNVKSLEERLMEKFKKLEKQTPEMSMAKEPEWTEPMPSVTGEPSLTVSVGDINISDFPFAWYLSGIQSKITSCWNEPKMVLDKKYSAIVSFTINKNGDVSNINIKRSSGIGEFDQSGIRAIELSKPFPQLPPGYMYQTLVVNVEFTLE